jgi:HD-like signal output (HDOD) protein
MITMNDSSSDHSSESKALGLEAWVTRLHRTELPVLGGVMRDLNRLTRESDTSVDQLAEVILRDASLTTKVLRLASSAYFNPQVERDVTTLSRAILKLGFNGIKAISLSVMLIDSLLRKGARQRMLQWLARGFHAAVQARALVQGRTDVDPEDVFVAALLLHVGDLAFWSSRGTDATLLEARLNDRRNDDECEREVLGTTLKEVTNSLAELWGMSDTLLDALSDESATNPAARAVQLGDAISLASEAGWDSPEMNNLLEDVAAFSGRGLIDLLPQLQRTAREAAAVAVSFGANAICHFIPGEDATVSNRPPAHRSDPQLQLKILREMATMIQEGVDANTLFQTVVEGVHRGAGFERVALCLIDPKSKLLQAKHVLGDDGSHWRETLRVSTRTEQDNLLAYVLHGRQLLWLKPGQRSPVHHLIDKTLQALLATDNCVITALYANTRNIGVLLADRGMGGEPITQEQYESFSHFSNQANMGLAMLAARIARR